MSAPVTPDQKEAKFVESWDKWDALGHDAADGRHPRFAARIGLRPPTGVESRAQTQMAGRRANAPGPATGGRS